MYWVKAKRIIKAGFVGFWRNGYVSLASVLVMTVTLFVVGSLVFNNALLKSSLDELKEMIDISVYFPKDAKEEEVLTIKKAIEALPEVSKVTYITEEMALEEFKKRHEDDELTLQALDELGDNPLGAVLNVKAKEPSQYEGVANYLKQYPDLSVNYFKNKEAIEKMNEIISSSETSNLSKTIVLIIISLLVTFNTIRLVIHVSRDEISVMKLVGASNMYIRGPFVITGLLCGLTAGIITIIVFYPITYLYGPLFYPFAIFLKTSTVHEMELFRYYIENFGEISLIMFFGGATLGIISSFLAVRRYLK